jgi:hypothetical protein
MIALLTDFGVDDIYVGVMKSVILSVDPTATIVDLSHSVPAHDIRAGSILLRAAWRHLPDRTVVVGIVDPGVGSDRRGVAVRIDGRAFVGPDNGILSEILALTDDIGAVELTAPEYQVVPRVGETFHGRDIFAPAAAHLNKGLSPASLGPDIDPATLARLPVRRGEISASRILAEIVHVDRFGNLIVDIESGPFLTWLSESNRVSIELPGGVSVNARAVNAYSSASDGEICLVPNSFGLVEIAALNRRASNMPGAAIGAKVAIRKIQEDRGVA